MMERRYTRSQEDPIWAWYAARRDWASHQGRVFIPNDSRTMHVGGSLRLCLRGLHASISPLDALTYGYSHWGERRPFLARVRVWGDVIKGEDKLCASYRQVVWYAPCEKACREMAWWYLRAAVYRVEKVDLPAFNEFVEFTRSFLRDFNHRTLAGYQRNVQKSIRDRFYNRHRLAQREYYSNGRAPYAVRSTLVRAQYAFDGVMGRVHPTENIIKCYRMFSGSDRSKQRRFLMRASREFERLIEKHRVEA